MQIKYPSLIVIDPKIVQCPHRCCVSSIENIPIYFRTSHLSDFTSHKLGEAYLKLKGNPFNFDQLKTKPQSELMIK